MTVMSIIMLFVWVVVIVGLAALAYWVISQIGVQPMILKWANIVIVVVAVLAIIMLLLNAFGMMNSPVLTPT